MKPGWWKELPGQIFNSATIAGIATLSTWAGADVVSFKVIGIAFGLPFLVEMRKYLDLGKRR